MSDIQRYFRTTLITILGLLVTQQALCADEPDTREAAQLITLPFTGFAHDLLPDLPADTSQPEQFFEADWFIIGDAQRFKGVSQLSVLPDLVRFDYGQEVQLPSGPSRTQIFPESQIFPELSVVCEYIRDSINATVGDTFIVTVSRFENKRDTIAGPIGTFEDFIPDQGDIFSAAEKACDRRPSETQPPATKPTDLYLEIKVSRIPTLDISLGQLTDVFSQSHRYLITMGPPTGQRNATWGSWLETIHIDTGVIDDAMPLDTPKNPLDDDLPITPIPDELVFAADEAGLTTTTPLFRMNGSSSQYEAHPFDDTDIIGGLTSGREWFEDSSLLGIIKKGFAAFIENGAEDWINKLSVRRGFGALGTSLVNSIGAGKIVHGTLSRGTNFLSTVNSKSNAAEVLERADSVFEGFKQDLCDLLFGDCAFWQELGDSIGMVKERVNSFKFNLALPNEQNKTYLEGGSLDDVLLGSNLADVMIGGNGDDINIPRGGDDVIFGGAGRDVVFLSKPYANYGVNTTSVTDSRIGDGAFLALTVSDNSKLEGSNSLVEVEWVKFVDVLTRISLRNQWLNASLLFPLTEDPRSISEYRFVDDSAGANTAQLWQTEVGQFEQRVLTVPRSQLDKVWFKGSNTAGADNLRYAVKTVAGWSEFRNFSIQTIEQSPSQAADSDGDGDSDGFEVINGLDPLRNMKSSVAAIVSMILLNEASAPSSCDYPELDETGAIVGQWTVDDEISQTVKPREGSYADYYIFDAPGDLAYLISLGSTDADAYLVLREGCDPSSPPLFRNDDVSSETRNAELNIPNLAKGRYLLEVTTYNENTEGEYVLLY